MADEPGFVEPAFDDQLALGWSIVRDCAGGRPPHVWTPFVRTEQAALYSAAAVATYGGVAAMNAGMRVPERDGEKWRTLYASTFAMGEKLSPHLAYARPIPWAVLHIGERSRNARLSDTKRMWREVFLPVLDAYRSLKEAHVPWVTISDADLERGLPTEAKVLVLPWPEELSEKQRSIVAAFEKAGGVVLRPKGDMPQPPIRITGPKAMHAVCYRAGEGKRLTICLMNSYGWFRTTRKPNPRLNNGTAPPPCTGVAIELTKEMGSPKRVVEVLTGRELDLEATADGVRVTVPDFQINACVLVEL
jgi:hypothetical protein